MAILFSNGTGIDSNYAIFNTIAQAIGQSDDFFLANNSTINKIVFNAVIKDDVTLSDTGVTWKIYSDNSGAVGPELFSGTSSSITEHFTSSGQEGYTLYDFSFDVPNIVLSAGIYWLNLRVSPIGLDIKWTRTGNGAYRVATSSQNVNFRIEGEGVTLPYPIIISTIEEIQLIGNDFNYPANWSYELGSDIDASDTINWNGGLGFEPTGGLIFNGRFDGKGYFINNLFINRPAGAGVGLFHKCDYGAEILNLTINDANITGDFSVGVLCGTADEHGTACTIHNVKSSGSVSGDMRLGGLIGFLESGEVSFCSSSCTVSGGSQIIGGLIGEASEATVIYNCFSSGDVSATGNDVGGFIGKGNVCTVSGCFSTGNVIGGGRDIGGFIGNADSCMVSGCFSTGNITGNNDAGGFIGDCSYGSDVSYCFSTGDVTGNLYGTGGFVGDVSSAIISNCYCSGNVVGVGTGYVGGFVGEFGYQSPITNCHCTGSVSGTTSTVGGFGASNFYGIESVTSSYWDIETSGVLTSVEGEGKTTAEMQTQSTFVGWDFSVLWGLNTYDEYKYPKFLCADFSSTQVSGEAPLEVGFINSSIDEVFPVETFLWDFGDGSYSSEENPTHTYTTSGEYTVTLTISSKGLSSEHKIFISVLSVAGDTLAKFISTPRYGVFPFRVDFNNLSINSNTYLWDFGDGITSTEDSPIHYYSAPGKYTVTLTSTNSTDSDIRVKEVYINSVSNKYQLNGYLSGSGIVDAPYKACSEFVTLGWIKSPICANGEYLVPLAIGDVNGKVVDSDRALKFMLKRENNDFRFVFNNSESQPIFKSVSINIQDDSWHSLGWVCVDSSGTMKFLVDGVDVPVRLGYNSATGLVYSKAYSSVGRVGGGEVWCPYLSNSGQRITLYNWRFAKGVSLDNNWIEELFKIDKLNLGLM